ncbi:MAG TPA: helicase-related protein, partial [Polyangiales bacterium]|nr:helicase-related protein [Polyangiales bacterium]
MTRSAFERIPMSPAAQKDYLEREVAAIDEMLTRANEAGAGYSRKRLEKTKLRVEERIKTKLDSVKDPGLTFEQLGIDYIFADEAHAYKNLRTSSNIPGMAVDGSMRASDLHMKIEYLRARGSRVATLATATPIANSMGEAYTMQRYLRPDLLEQSGISDFDQWAATFGKTTTAIEVAADGSGLRMQTRFASFRNVPELLQQWQVSADIKTAEDLQLPVPALQPRQEDGKRVPEVVVVQPSATLSMYVRELAARADRVRQRHVDPSEDNLLKISSDGRAAGLDVRLVREETDALQKLDVAAERIAAIYHAHRMAVFPGSDGKPHPRPGALQLVFCDLGTPKDDAWSVYGALRASLVAKGLPAQAVRFVHEARDDREKGELFAACRDGRVAVLLGSTEKMGVGTNVQLRAVALHHMDCPWRPADIAQREGRILRQGNANAEVQILRYVTEGSFDGYLWQTVSRKAQFIAQVMRGRLDVREIEDIGDAALSYQEVKALAAGNPLLLDHARSQAEVTRFERLQRAHANKQSTLRWTLQRSDAAAA